jgi:O-antigen/teichoic acid export membrane protein
MFDYSLWHLAGNSATVLNTHGINILLNLFFGTVVNAAKGVANQVLTAVRGFANNFMMALNPQITQSYAKRDFDYMFNLVYKGSRFSFYLMLIPSLPIIINAEAILSIWLKEVPEHAVFFVQFSLIAALISTISNTLITAQNATGNVRNYQLIVGGILLLNFPFCYIALKLGASPESTMVIAVIIEVVALFARIFMIPIYIKEFNAMDYIKKVVLDCLYVCVVSTVLPLALYILLPDNWVTFTVVTIVALLTSMIAVFYVGCSISERKMIESKVMGLFSGFTRK